MKSGQFVSPDTKGYRGIAKDGGVGIAIRSYMNRNYIYENTNFSEIM